LKAKANVKVKDFVSLLNRDNAPFICCITEMWAIALCANGTYSYHTYLFDYYNLYHTAVYLHSFI